MERIALVFLHLDNLNFLNVHLRTNRSHCLLSESVENSDLITHKHEFFANSLVDHELQLEFAEQLPLNDSSQAQSSEPRPINIPFM